jgi:antirestriction protein
MAGGSMETPRIYVADLEAYNNGRLVGEWLDLADYNDADELMEAIQDVLKKSGGEQYAIHDAEYIPRSMYSEYMGQRDFEELYEMMDLAKDNDLPLEVVQEIVSQYDSSAINEFQGKYDSADDFAQQLVDDLGGIQNFNNFERYLTISETDRRLLAQEMADSYVDDIRDEDGGNRLISEAGMDVDEYEGADEDTQEEMLNNAREIVYDEYYDTWYDGLNDPYYFLVEEQGMYSAEDFANANFVQVDYEDLGDALEDDYTYIFYDSDLYVFNIR